MRISDLISLSVKKLKSSWAVLPAIGFCIAAFCLCFAGAILTKVQDEKAEPYEIIISAESTSLSESLVAEISKTTDVTAVTPLLQVPATISTGEYTASLTLTGLKANYLKEGLSQGSIFPDDSVMPYIVLNEAACKQFATDDGDVKEATSDTEMPEIGWLNENFEVQTGEGAKVVISKVCGILSNEDEDEDQEPAAYISLSAAKALLQQSTGYTGINVRVRNIGCTESIAKAIAKLGLSVSNSTDELQAGWDADTKEMTYLLVIGVFGLVCASFLLGAWRRLSLSEQKDEWEMLRCLGMKERDIRRVFAVQAGMLAVLGIAGGMLIAMVIPSFLLSGEVGDTSFLLPIPFNVILGCVVVCATAGIVPVLGRRGQGGK